MTETLRKYAFVGRALTRLAKGAPKKGPVERNLDRIGKAGLATIPVAAGVTAAQKYHHGFEPGANAAHFGLPPTE